MYRPSITVCTASSTMTLTDGLGKRWQHGSGLSCRPRSHAVGAGREAGRGTSNPLLRPSAPTEAG